MKNYIRRLLLLLSLATVIVPLSSCGLLIEGADIAIRRSKQVPKGTAITGQGFDVRCPDDYYYPIKDIPNAGGVTFRPTDTMSDGDVYFVAPFQSATARNPKEALIEWNRRSRLRVEVLSQNSSMFNGMPAVTAALHWPHGSGGFVGSMKVAGHGPNYLIITRGRAYYFANRREHTIHLCERERAFVEKCMTLTR